MKHLKVRARLVPPDHAYVDVTVVEQTHTGSDFAGFGHGRGFESRVFGYKNVRIRNKDKRAKFEFTGTGPGHFGIELTLGEGNAVGRTVRVPIKYWPEIKEAIIGYNELGKYLG